MERGWIFKCVGQQIKMKFGRPYLCLYGVMLHVALSGIRLLYTQPKVTAMITVTFPISNFSVLLKELKVFHLQLNSFFWQGLWLLNIDLVTAISHFSCLLCNNSLYFTLLD